MNATTLSDIIEAATAQLTKADVTDADLNAEFLAAHALGIKPAQLAKQRQRALTAGEAARIQALIDRRATRATISRILGKSEFRKLTFGLNEATLEPRPDSEVLVRAALRHLKKKRWPSLFRLAPRGTKLRLLDLGTGTGCLLLSLLHALPGATGLGIDLAPRAVEQAQKNAEQLGLAHRAAFRVNDWIEGIDESFDLIISNPPYITHAEIPGLIPAVRDHDPMLALDGGADGLDPYRHLIPLLPPRLKPGGAIVFEVGYAQAHSVAALLDQTGFTDITIYRDAGGVDRCVMAVKPL